MAYFDYTPRRNGKTVVNLTDRTDDGSYRNDECNRVKKNKQKKLINNGFNFLGTKLKRELCICMKEWEMETSKKAVKMK